MSGAHALKVSIFLPGRYGRLELAKRYAKVLQKCTSCGSPLVLLMEKFGDIEQNHVTRNGDHVMTGGWYCNECGLHMVPGEDVKLLSMAEQILPQDTPATASRTNNTSDMINQTPAFKSKPDFNQMLSPVRSPIKVLTQATSHHKPPTLDGVFGSDKENSRPVLDDDFVNWERHLQLNFQDFLGNVREHYVSKENQLKQLKENLKIREATLEISERSYQERLKKLSAAAQQARQTLHNPGFTGNPILSPFREGRTTCTCEVAIQTDLHFDLKESIESGYSSGYTSSSQERHSSPTRQLDNMQTDHIEIVPNRSNLILQTNPPLPPRKRKTPESHQEYPVTSGMSPSRSSEDIIKDIHTQSQAAGQIITLLEDWTKRKQQKLGDDDYHRDSSREHQHMSPERVMTRAYRDQKSRSASRETAPLPLSSKPDHLTEHSTVRPRRPELIETLTVDAGLWTDVSQNQTPSRPPRNRLEDRGRTVERPPNIGVMSPSPDKALKHSPTKPCRTMVTSPERQLMSLSATPASLTKTSTSHNHQSGRSHLQQDVPTTPELHQSRIDTQNPFKLRTDRRNLSPPQPRMGSKQHFPTRDSVQPRTWVPDRTKLSTNPNVRSRHEGTPTNNTKTSSHTQHARESSTRYVYKTEAQSQSGDMIERQVNRAIADRRSRSAGTIRNSAEMALLRSDSMDNLDNNVNPLAQSTPTTTLQKNGPQEYVTTPKSSQQLSSLAQAILSPTKLDSGRTNEIRNQGIRGGERKVLSPLHEEGNQRPSYQSARIQPRKPVWDTRTNQDRYKAANVREEYNIQSSVTKDARQQHYDKAVRDLDSDNARRQLFVTRRTGKEDRPRSWQVLDDHDILSETPARFSSRIDVPPNSDRQSVKHSVQRFEQHQVTNSAPQKRPINRFRRRSRSVELDWLG